MTAGPLQLVLDRLSERDLRWSRRSGDQYSAQCPHHDDTKASVSIKWDGEKVLINCQAGCTSADVVNALDLGMGDLFAAKLPARRRLSEVARYPFTDERGETLFWKIRYEPKDFRCQLPDGSWKLGETRRVLYRLPELLDAIAAGKPVLICEGEKDCDRAVSDLGMAATCNFDGAGKWRPEYTGHFRGAEVIIVADNDGPGHAHARAVASALNGVARSVRVVKAAVDTPGADLSDHVDRGREFGHLIPVVLDKTASEPHSGPGEAAPAPRRLRMVKASSIVPKRAQWLWQTGEYGRIPVGEVSLAAGRGNVGKSPFALWIAARLTLGELEGAFLGRPVDVAVYASEDSIHHTTVPRLIAAGADLDRVHFIEGTETDQDADDAVIWLRDLPLIEEALEQASVRFLVIDPLIDVHKAGADSHKVDDVRAGIRPLAAMAHRLGVTVLGISHFNKAKSTDLAALLSGSHGLRDIVRAVIAFVVAPDGQRVLGQDKNNLGRSGDDVPALKYDMTSVNVAIEGELVSQPVFTITGTSEATLTDLLGDDEKDQTKLDRRLVWMFDALADAHPDQVPASELATLAATHGGGLKWDSLRRKALASGLMEWDKDGFAGGWVWSLTKAGVERSASRARGGTRPISPTSLSPAETSSDFVPTSLPISRPTSQVGDAAQTASGAWSDPPEGARPISERGPRSRNEIGTKSERVSPGQNENGRNRESLPRDVVPHDSDEPDQDPDWLAALGTAEQTYADWLTNKIHVDAVLEEFAERIAYTVGLDRYDQPFPDPARSLAEITTWLRAEKAPIEWHEAAQATWPLYRAEVLIADRERREAS